MKQNVLAFLEAHKGAYVSGETIAKSLHMTRANVWKNINKLREDGLTIEAISRKGYMLIDAHDALSKQHILSGLDENTIDEIMLLDTVDSTNDYAKTIANEKTNVLILANQQTKGKGRHGKSFYSPNKKGIYMTLILKPTLSILDTQYLTIIAALAIVEGIKKSLNLDVSIKWLNDIYIHDLKLAGILTEAQIILENSSYDYVIIGMGINTHTTPVPSDIETIYTALDQHAQHVNRNEIISAILNAFFEHYHALETNKSNIIQTYKHYNFVLGRYVYINNQRVKAIDISETGHLIVQEASGTIRELNAEEISIRSTL